MKVLHLVGSVDPRHGGPVEVVIGGARAWAARGHERHVATLDSPGDPWLAECPLRCFPLGLRSGAARRLRSRLSVMRYGYTPHLVPFLARHAPAYDTVLVHGLWNYAAFGASRVLGRAGMPPYAAMPHGMLDPWFRGASPLKHAGKQVSWLLGEGRLLAKAAAVLFTAEDERRLARTSFAPYRAREVVVGAGAADPFAADPSQAAADAHEAAFRRHVGLGARRSLLYLSRIHPKKGCDLLLHAFAAVAPAHPDLDLVVAGPDPVGWRAELEGLAASLGIAERVRWPGMVTGDLKRGAFAACEAFVLPSHQENFGIVLAEALAAGRPVLTTHKVNIWREIEGDGAGLVAPDDVAGITDLLRRFLALAPADAAALRERARACYLRRFEIGRATDTLLDVLESVAASR